MGIKNQIISLFGGRIRTALELADPEFAEIREMRVRAKLPFSIRIGSRELFLEEGGGLAASFQNAIRPSLREIKDILENACGYSGYAFEEELKQGFLTIAGGHRIGISGQAVMQKKEIVTLKYISALNIRVAHSVEGCAEPWKEYFYKKNQPCHCLIISPPGCGKTTLLRDVIRLYSEGSENCPAVTVGVADERSEIAGCCRGERTHFLGMRTDVLDGCPKALAMEMLLRSMAPDVLAADEIAAKEVSVIEHALHCGCKMLVTLHGEELSDFLEKPGFENLAKEKVFERYIFLKGGREVGKISGIYDRDFRVLWKEALCT